MIQDRFAAFTDAGAGARRLSWEHAVEHPGHVRPPDGLHEEILRAFLQAPD
jgi:hypothetical protein